MTVWALTLPQVAATLAATLVAYHTVNADGQRMLDERMLNAVLVLVLASSILGPMLTERFAPCMIDAETRQRGARINCLQSPHRRSGAEVTHGEERCGA